jgi:hypothetical protein
VQSDLLAIRAIPFSANRLSEEANKVLDISSEKAYASYSFYTIQSSGQLSA